MTAAQRANIGRGVKYAAMRKRQSEAMKASWARRRANGAVEVFHPAPEPVAIKRSNLYQVAKLLGIDADEVLRDKIEKTLVEVKKVIGA